MFAQLPLGLNKFGPLSRNCGRQFHRAAILGSGRDPWCAAISKRPLISQRETVRHLLRVRLVQRLAKFAAVDFRVLADLGLHFLWIVIPTLQMARTEFSLGIFLIAGALLRLAHLDFLFRGGASTAAGAAAAAAERPEGQRALRKAVLPVMPLAVWIPRPFVDSPLSSK